MPTLHGKRNGTVWEAVGAVELSLPYLKTTFFLDTKKAACVLQTVCDIKSFDLLMKTDEIDHLSFVFSRRLVTGRPRAMHR